MSKVTRRVVLKYGTAGAALLLAPRWGVRRALGSVLPPLSGGNIPKYLSPLVVPPVMPRTSRVVQTGGKNVEYYEIAVRQFQQQILPAGLPPTTVWGFGSINHPGSFHYPSFTIEATWRKPVRVRWINDLRDPATGLFLPHLLPVDPTLHWANPPGGLAGRDTAPDFSSTGTPGPYRGPVPFVTHLHGAEGVAQESDGYPEAWFLPAASGIPAGFATTGTFYDHYKLTSPLGDEWGPGSAVFQYENDQRAATLWYHDHTLGVTRANVYAGPAGFYLIRGGPDDLHGHQLPGPAPAPGDPPGTQYFEIPLAIQDRAFNDDGSLFYPDSRAFFDGFAGPFIPDSDIAPIHNPEFFGDVMVVNGQAWPHLDVEQRRYRFRILNGCNSRFLLLALDNGLPFWVIGTEGGFLDAPVPVARLLLSPAERFDVIVDFTHVPVNTEIILRNLGPDEPFGGGEPGVDFYPADPATTGQVMRLRVRPATSTDKSKPPHELKLPSFKPLGAASATRQLSLNELDSAVLPGVGPAIALLGTAASGVSTPLLWTDPVTENPAVGATEIWELMNFTEDAHPIHIHEVQFQVVDRQPITGGRPRPPEPWETGFKDTVIAYPGEVTRVKVTFRQSGLFAWHCHIVEHEDNEMMRPYHIGPIPGGLPL